MIWVCGDAFGINPVTVCYRPAILCTRLAWFVWIVHLISKSARCCRRALLSYLSPFSHSIYSRRDSTRQVDVYWSSQRLRPKTNLNILMLTSTHTHTHTLSYCLDRVMESIQIFFKLVDINLNKTSVKFGQTKMGRVKIRKNYDRIRWRAKQRRTHAQFKRMLWCTLVSPDCLVTLRAFFTDSVLLI